MAMINIAGLDTAETCMLEGERKFCQPAARTERIKIERNTSALVRFLPFPQGPAREPFVRISQHWFDKRCVTCKVETSPSLGGDPDYECPICHTLQVCRDQTDDEDEKDDLYAFTSRISYRAYCLVLSKVGVDGRQDDTEGDALLVPYEFTFSKAAFSVFQPKFERSKARKGASKLGLIDLETGTNVWVNKSSTGTMTFDLDDGPSTVIPIDDNTEANIQRIWKRMTQPNIKFFTNERMEAIAEMVAAKAFSDIHNSLGYGSFKSNSGNGNSNRGNGRSAPRRGYENDSEPEQVRSPVRSSRPVRQTVREDVPEGEEDYYPTTRQAPRQAPPKNNFSRAMAAIEEPEQEQEADEQPAPPVSKPRYSRPQPVEEEPAEDEAPPVTTSRGGSTARPANREVETAPVKRPASVSVPPSVLAARRNTSDPIPAPPSANEGGQIDDSDDSLPEGDTDDIQPEQVPVATPPVKRPVANTQLASRISQSIKNITASGR